MEKSSELIIYILINNDFSMGKGKIVAQASHVIANMTEHLVKNNPDLWRQYTEDGMHPKICLRATEEQLKALTKKYPHECFWICDAGRTQVPAGTLTALAFLPMSRNYINFPSELVSLKLL